MIRLTPTERVAASANDFGSEPTKVSELEAYEKFLRNTDAKEAELVEKFSDPDVSKRYMNEANVFAECVRDLLDAVGKNARLHRLLLV